MKSLKKVVFQSRRRFVVFSYTTSHGLLLLRGAKTSTLSSRCDVLFRDVRALELRVWADGITIYEAESTDLSNFKSAPEAILEDGLVAYVIEVTLGQGLSWLAWFSTVRMVRTSSVQVRYC
jgi:hypothetical protein